MKVLESNFDTFRLERAWIDSEGQPRALVSGIVCNIDTKPGPLRDGLAFCEPVDPLYQPDWPVLTRVWDDRGGYAEFACLTDNPAVLAAARKFRELALAGQASPGTSLA